MISLLLCLSSFGQTWRGTVFDAQNHTPIPGVAVYLNGTSVYSITNAEGKFELSPKQFINTDLVLSHLSYETLTYEKPFDGLPEVFYMTEKSNLIDNIVITPSPFSRKKELELFREYFLGTSRSAKSCTIENESEIYFRYSPAEGVLRAYCTEPIRIDNPYLGYSILFHLSEFRLTFSVPEDIEHSSFLSLTTGSSTFTDHAPEDLQIVRRRQETYEGSMRSFFKDWAYHNQLVEGTGYLPPPERWTVRSSMPGEPRFYAVMPNPSGRTIRIVGTPEHQTIADGLLSGFVYDKIRVRYRKGTSSNSYLTFLHNEFLVDYYGNVDKGASIYTTGDMGEKRIGDSLPLDYEPAD